MLGVIRLLLFATAAGLAQRALHAAGHAIGIEDHPPVDVARRAADRLDQRRDRKSVVWGKSVSVRVDLGGRRIIKKKNTTRITQTRTTTKTITNIIERRNLHNDST